MSDAIAVLLWTAIEIALIFTGRAVVALASFGRWRGEQPGHAEARIYGPAGALSFKRKGQRVITSTALLFVGALFYVVVAVATLWLVSLP